jgi:signal transduction histidine kinase
VTERRREGQRGKSQGPPPAPRRAPGSNRSKAGVEEDLRGLAARVEQRERKRNDVLEREQRLKVFLGMAAHELLRPLIMAEAYAAMIGEHAGYGLDPGCRRDLDRLARVSADVRELIEALLLDTFDEERPIAREPVDLQPLLEHTVAALDSELRARRARVELAAMPVVCGNPAMLRSVFANLLANAIKYSPRAGAKISVSARRSDAGWTFAVTGPGQPIPEDERDLVFSPWCRRSDDRRARGAGLGLAIVRHIVERHGGHVGVTAPDDSSNRFYFTLPVSSGTSQCRKIEVEP